MTYTFNEILDWIADAEEDGWTRSRLYYTEPMYSASVLERDGFVVQAITRDRTNFKLSAWGPDKLQVKVPRIYWMRDLMKALRVCDECGATDIEPHRFSFAGRCCKKCLPKMQKLYEQPGWTD